MKTKLVRLVGWVVLALALVLVLPPHSAEAATTYTWTGASNSTWTTAGNWSPSRTTPAVDDILVFDGTQTNQPTLSANQTVGRILVTGNSTLTIATASGTVTLTSSGGAPNSFSVNAGVTFTITTSGSGGNGIVSVGTNGGNVAGTVTLSGRAQLTSTDATNQLVFVSGATCNSALLASVTFGTFGGTSGIANSVRFQSGSTFNHNSGGNPFQRTQPSSIVIFDQGSNYNFNFTGSATISAAGRTYPNVTFGGTAGITYAQPSSGTANWVINGTLTINSSITLGGNGWTGQTRISGNIVNNGVWTSALGNLVMLNGAALQTISGSGTTTFTTGVTIGASGASISSGATVNLNANSFLTGALDVSGTLNTGTAAVFGIGAFSLASGATLGLGSPDGIDSGTAVGNIPVSGTRTFDPGANYTFNGSAAQNTGTGFPAAMYNLTINNSAGVVLSNDFTVNGTLALTSGDLTTTASYVLTLGSGASVAGAGDVIGTVRRTSPATGLALQFNNQYTTINFASAPTQMDVKLTKFAPSGLTTAVSRYYTLTPTGSANAMIQLAYLATELNGTTETHEGLWRYNGSRWVLQGGTVNTTNHYVSLPGVTVFSDWAISDNGLPSAVTLSSFSASAPPFDLWQWLTRCLGR